MLRQKLKIAHNMHSGRWRPHEYTSYPVLFALLFLVGVSLTASSVLADHPGPQSGSVGLVGTVPGQPPTVAPVIKSPSNGQHFSSVPITVSGTCPDNTIVEIFKSSIFGGSGPCDNATFSIQSDLLYGSNDIVAKAYDALDQAGPDSATVTVFYDASAPQTSSLEPLDFSSAQLILDTTAVYRGVFPGQTLTVPISILGGSPPYAVNVQWGDSSNKIVPRPDNLTFNLTHVYNKPGVYQITTQATDGQSRVAFLAVAAIVNGQPVVASTANPTNLKGASSKLLILWPVYVIGATMVVSFWYGERREKRLLGGAYLNLHPQG